MVSVHSLSQDSHNFQTGQKQAKNQLFLIHSSRFLDGFEQLSAELGYFLQPENTASLCSQGTYDIARTTKHVTRKFHVVVVQQQQPQRYIVQGKVCRTCKVVLS